MGNRRDNTGKPYEILVQAIFQAIHDQEEVATLLVKRNKTLAPNRRVLEVRERRNPLRSHCSGERLAEPGQTRAAFAIQGRSGCSITIIARDNDSDKLAAPVLRQGTQKNRNHVGPSSRL